MREKVLGSIVLVLAAVFATWAVRVDAADRNVVRERSGPLERCPDSPTGRCDDDVPTDVRLEERRDLRDRGGKKEVPDPVGAVDCETCAYGYLWSKDSSCLDSAGNIDYGSPCENGMYGVEAIGSVRIIREPDIAVPKPTPVATCATDACTDHCRSSSSECDAFAKKICEDKHPLPPGSTAIKFRQVTSFKLGIECAFYCPTAGGDMVEYECLTQKEIDARKKKRQGPVSAPEEGL